MGTLVPVAFARWEELPGAAGDDGGEPRGRRVRAVCATSPNLAKISLEELKTF